MKIVDSRRLTGPNLYARGPGALCEVEWEPGDVPARALAAWQDAIEPHLGPEHGIAMRTYAGGAALFVSATPDICLAMTDLNEWAVAVAQAVVGGFRPPEWDPGLAQAVEDARQPALLALVQAAEQRGLPVLIDDSDLTIGAGRRMLRLSREKTLPSPAEVDWTSLGNVPTALITGTNGKTTTTRLVARMVKLTGKVPGNTSSDGVVIDEEFLTRGDWSGPDAARLVLRHPQVEIALLETARGGILRRGLASHHADAALITNVSADHLGSYGIDDVAGMAQVKAVVAEVSDTAVLNAGDPELLALGERLGEHVVWFGPRGWRLADGWVTAPDGERLVQIKDVPLTFGGQAAYNVENVLAASALASVLGLPRTAIVQALRTFTTDARDNPGRGNLSVVDGKQVLVDFGHNPAAVRGVLALAHSLKGEQGRVWVTVGMPGDRPDAEIAEVASVLAKGAVHEVLVRELPDHLRGRDRGVVPAMLVRQLEGAGVRVRLADGELAAVEQALAEARSGDVILVLTHLDPAVDAMLATRRPLEG